MLLRSRTGTGTGSSVGLLLAKKLALDAVMGVLGIPFGPTLGGGVIDPESTAAVPSYRAAILAAVGVLKGRRFIGGNLRGWSVRLLLLILRILGLLSLSKVALPGRGFFIEDFRGSIGASLSVDGVGIPSAVEILCKLMESFGRLDLRAEKNGWSISALGES